MSAYRSKPASAGIRASAAFLLASAGLVAGCATTTPRQEAVAAPVSQAAQVQAQQQQAAQVAVKTLKRKVAIGRFTNETRYGKSFQVDAAMDPLGKQLSDMMSSRLQQSGQFLVFERPDLAKIEGEQALSKSANLIGVDALIVGSVTEFGRSTTGKAGFLSSTKLQTARAKVEIRLVDVRTGYVFFSTSGVGEATTESGEVAGFGSKADYDGTLNDRAIGAAVTDLQNGLLNKLNSRPWRTDILKVDGGTVYISGGTRQGLKVGDRLDVLKKGETVKSQQSGFGIDLPPTKVASLTVTGFFGEDETNEGAVATVSSGAVPAVATTELYVGEAK